MIHPYDMTHEEFFALPINTEDGPYPLRSKTDPTGLVDGEGHVWVPVQQADGSWARRHIFTL